MRIGGGQPYLQRVYRGIKWRDGQQPTIGEIRDWAEEYSEPDAEVTVAGATPGFPGFSDPELYYMGPDVFCSVCDNTDKTRKTRHWARSLAPGGPR